MSLLENIPMSLLEFRYCFRSLSHFRQSLCPMSLFHSLYVAILRQCHLSEFTLTWPHCTIVLGETHLASKGLYTRGGTEALACEAGVYYLGTAW